METKTHADKIILKKAAFKDDTLEQAVAKLQKYTDEAAPSGESVKIKLDPTLVIPALRVD